MLHYHLGNHRDEYLVNVSAVHEKEAKGYEIRNSSRVLDLSYLFIFLQTEAGTGHLTSDQNHERNISPGSLHFQTVLSFDLLNTRETSTKLSSGNLAKKVRKVYGIPAHGVD